MEENDLNKAAHVHAEAFPRQKQSLEWLRCSLKAFPRLFCYVTEQDNQIIGYIIWAQKSGFRPEATIELEQIAIHPNVHGKGFGQNIIEQSLIQVKQQLSKNGSSIKNILISTRADNQAQKLYRKALGAEVEATISNLYSADEVYMVARHV